MSTIHRDHTPTTRLQLIAALLAPLLAAAGLLWTV